MTVSSSEPLHNMMQPNPSEHIRLTRPDDYVSVNPDDEFVSVNQEDLFHGEDHRETSQGVQKKRILLLRSQVTVNVFNTGASSTGEASDGGSGSGAGACESGTGVWYANLRLCQKTEGRVGFLKQFKSAPAVMACISSADVSNGANFRVRVYVTAVDSKGFTVHADSWADTQLYSCRVSWIAVGE
ncbi:hypothetical protein F5X99DRAFT_158443 [Biscogniauxia marginata]|nr:hypothetical protein F5X99DRAFT_158443 [Biscogniauxia marginata]